MHEPQELGYWNVFQRERGSEGIIDNINNDNSPHVALQMMTLLGTEGQQMRREPFS